MARPSTREKILDCAERLYAEHGLGGISLRAINAEAGLSPAALHYHFGNQQAVVEALLERQMPRLMTRRRALLDVLDRRSKAPTTRDVLGALLQPQVEMLAERAEPGLRYLRFIHRLQTDGDLDSQFVIDRWPGGVDRLAPLLRRANPHLPPALIHFRMTLSIDAILRSLAQGTPPGGGGLEAHASALLDFLTGAFEAPVTGDNQ